MLLLYTLVYYLCYCLLLPQMGGVVLMKYMQVQNCMVPPAATAAATCAINVLATYLGVHQLGFVVRGQPLPVTCSYCLSHAATACHMQPPPVTCSYCLSHARKGPPIA